MLIPLNLLEMKKLLLFISMLLCSNLFAQREEIKPKNISSQYLIEIQEKSKSGNMLLAFTSIPDQADMRFNPDFFPAASENESDEETQKQALIRMAGQRKSQAGTFPDTDESSEVQGIDFKITEGFFPGLSGGCPNDNSVAVSNSNRIMGMVNGSVGIYTTGGRKINIYSLDRFFKSHVHGPCDPKVIYDPSADRFIMFAQSCREERDNIAIAFSNTNNPNGRWNFYLFPTDVDGQNSWSDYPKIGYTKKEVFLSLRIFSSDRKYKQTVLYQMDKLDGYSGRPLTYRLWQNLPFSTAVVRSGIGVYGPGAYLVNTSSHSGSDITLIDITDNLDNNPKLIKYKIPTPPYQVSGPCSQPEGAEQLDPGDCRLQDAYYQNGIIHFVFSDNQSDWVAVRYHRLDVNNMDGMNYKLIHFAGTKDYTYPCLSPFTNDLNNQTSIVFFQATGPDYYPEIRGKVFDNNFEYQSSRVIYAGKASVTKCYSNRRGFIRWGDYTGIAFKYDAEIPTVWVAGSIGRVGYDGWHTYMAELTATGYPIATKDLTDTKISISPNPGTDRIYIYVESNIRQGARFYLIDQMGNQISMIMSNVLYQGVNTFSFDVGTLPAGSYFIRIVNDQNQIVKNEKIQVIH